MRENWMKWDLDGRLRLRLGAFFNQHGSNGYGFYLVIIELLYKEDTHRLPLDDVQNYALICKVEHEDAKLYIDALLNIGVLLSDATHFWCPIVIEREAEREQQTADLSEKRRAAAEARWNKAGKSTCNSPDGMQTDANAARVDESRIDESRVEPVPRGTGVGRQPRSAKSWPPEGEEVAPNVFLTPKQRNQLLESMCESEAEYWIRELADKAEQNPARWRSEYRNHFLVIQKWRRMKYESGFVWNEATRLYGYPNKKGGIGSKNNFDVGVETTKILREMEEQQERGHENK